LLSESKKKGNIEYLYEDGRSPNNSDSFYDVFPEIEIEAKLFVMEKAVSKSSLFSVRDLENFITEQYDILTNDDCGDLSVRSSESCRHDLLRWGFYLGENRLRPYCEGKVGAHNLL
jgi:hypothetical protein